MNTQNTDRIPRFSKTVDCDMFVRLLIANRTLWLIRKAVDW